MDGKSLQASPIPSASFRCCPAIPALRQPPIPAPAHVTRPLVLDHQGDDHLLVEEKTKVCLFREEAFSLSDISHAGGFCTKSSVSGPGSCFPLSLLLPEPMNALAPLCSCRISPPSTLPIQGEPAARPGLKFPVNFLVLINLGAVSKVKEDHNTIHGELHNLGDESKGNGMKFKTTKCNVMHLGINKKFCSKLGAHQLETREEQRDVSVLVNQRMAMSHQGVALWKSRSLRVLQVKHSQFRPVALQWCHGQDFTWGVLCMENVLSTGKNGQGNKEGLRKDLDISWSNYWRKTTNSSF